MGDAPRPSGAAPQHGARDLDPVLHRLVGFGRYCRRHGLPVGTGRVLAFCRAAAALDPFDREDVRIAARATLVSRPEDLPTLDALFAAYFRAPAESPAPAEAGAPSSEDEPPPPPQTADEIEGEPEPTEQIVSSARWAPLHDEEEDESDEGEEQAAIRLLAGATEVLREKDFAQLSEEERRVVLALVRHLAMHPPVRRSRRYRASAHGARFDFRRTLRRSLRTEGEPFRRAWKDRRTRIRPLLLILDVSGSMAPYARPLVEFAHAATRAGRRVEVFCFGTRLTRITRALRTREPDEALAAVGRTVNDWEGGTRIGDSLKTLLEEWAPRAALRGSVAVICSDGLEWGDPETLARQVARLRRLTYRLIWVNPLKGNPSYEPLARGMAAALPHVDVFLPGHNLESLQELARVVARP